MKVRRKLFLVLLGNDEHGKSHIIRAFVAAGKDNYGEPKDKGAHIFKCCSRCLVNGYVFIRAYQEKEKGIHGNVEDTLKTNDGYSWWEKDLVVMASHADNGDINDMIHTAHASGFNTIIAYIILNDNDMMIYRDILIKHWDERWEILNQSVDNKDEWERICAGIGREIFNYVCKWLCRV